MRNIDEAILVLYRALSVVDQAPLDPDAFTRAREQLRQYRRDLDRLPGFAPHLDALHRLLGDATLSTEDPEDVIGRIDAYLHKASISMPWYLHGTTSGRLPAIAKNGLVPISQSSRPANDNGLRKVCFTTCEVSAWRYARAAVERFADVYEVQTKPIVLRVPRPRVHAAGDMTAPIQEDPEGISGLDVFVTHPVSVASADILDTPYGADWKPVHEVVPQLDAPEVDALTA